MDLRKLFSSLALTAMILASLVGICKQMLVSCGIDCSQQSMSAMQMDSKADGCSQNSTVCSTASMGDHMTTFASMYPSVATDAASLLLVVAVAFFVAWFLVTKIDLGDNEKLRAKLRSLRWGLSNSISPNFLILAFSRGILNSKIYA
jgi:hypothetical protein